MRRVTAGAVALTVFLILTGCGSGESPQQQHHDANTPAGKMGQAAHAVATQADKAGKVIGRELGKAAHDAHEGWKEASRKSADKK